MQDRNNDWVIEARGRKRAVLVGTQIGVPEFTNAEERLGICKHSLTGMEYYTNDCLFVVVTYEAKPLRSPK